MNSLALKTKLAIVIVAMVVVTTFLGATVYYSLEKGNDDADVVNAAGRQRMLSQAMSKSVLSYSSTRGALQGIQTQIFELSRYITNMRQVYSTTVTRPAKQAGMLVSAHPEAETMPALPLPATFTRLVGEAFKVGGNVEVDVIAKEPLNPEQGLRDEIDRQAFEAILADPEKIFSQDVERDGKLYLRFYAADRATSELKGGYPYKIGDVMGVRRFSVLFAKNPAVGRARLTPNLDEYETSLQVFSRTLAAFKSGGAVPADLEMRNSFHFPGVGDSEQRSKISEIEGKFKDFTDSVDRLLGAQVGSDDYWLAQREVPNLANELRRTSDELTSLFSNAAHINQTNVRLAVGVMVVVTIIAFLGLYFLLSRVVLTPLAEMARVADRIAEGDLTQRLQTDRSDEVGRLFGALDAMSQNLNHMLAKVAHSSRDLVVSGDNIVQATQRVTDGAAHQSQQTEIVGASAKEMVAVSLDISRNSSEAAEAASRASQVAQQGGDAVRRGIEGMGRVSRSVADSARHVEQLAQHSGQIGQIAAVIDEIANQTNLLALNAAIEAARAGDMGRGFAVVADEVRQLATRTTDATKEIAEMIRNIQNGTQTAVSSMQEGRNEVEAGSELVTQTGQSLQQIVEVVEGLSERIGHIAAAAREQNTSMNKVTTNIADVSDIARAAKEQAGISAQSCTEISGLAADLQTMIGRFKL